LGFYYKKHNVQVRDVNNGYETVVTYDSTS